jgi:hypothetical protein
MSKITKLSNQRLKKRLKEKSGIWGFQTKDFDFIAGDVLSDSILKKKIQ